MNHYFDLGYCDGLYGNYYGKSVSRTLMTKSQEAAYLHGFECGRKDLLAEKN